MCDLGRPMIGVSLFENPRDRAIAARFLGVWWAENLSISSEEGWP
jgi:hypothetical protein